MRRSTLCLRSVHLPLRWLHPAEGSFLGTEGNGPGWVGIDSGCGWAFGIRRRSGWLWRICGSRLVTQGKSAGRWFARGKALDWVGFQGVAGKSGRERMFPGQKRSPALQCGERGFRKLFVVSGKSGQALEACPLWLWFEVLDVKSWTVTDPGWPHRSHHTSTLQRLVRTQMGGRPEGCMNGGG